MPAIPVPYATIGGARLAIVNNRTRDNDASTLYTSYADTTKKVTFNNAFDYNMVATLGGLPLSVSLFTDPGHDPSALIINQTAMFYALDVIEINQAEDGDWPGNPSDIGVLPSNPSDNTFTWNGNRLSASKKSNRYYMNIVDSGNTGDAHNQVMLMGLAMAQGAENELLLNKTSYTLSDVDEFKTVALGGSPLSVGRIANDYYLMVSPILAADA